MVTVASLVTELGIEDRLTPALEQAQQTREHFRVGVAALNQEVLRLAASMRDSSGNINQAAFAAARAAQMANMQAEAERKLAEAQEQVAPRIARLKQIEDARLAGQEKLAAALTNVYRAEQSLAAAQSALQNGTVSLRQGLLQLAEASLQLGTANRELYATEIQMEEAARREAAGLTRLQEVEAARVAGNQKLANALMGVYRAEQSLLAARSGGNFAAVAQAENQMANALKRVDEVTNTVSNSTNRLSGVFSNMGSRILVALRNTVLYGTTYQVLGTLQQVIQGMSDDIIQLADATGKLSAISGEGAETTSALLNAAKEWGITASVLTPAIGHLEVQQRMLTGAQEEGRKAGVEFQAALRALGVETTKSNGEQKNSYQLFLDVADAISKTDDSAKAMTLAAKAFGETGARDLLPFLKQGRAGIEQLEEAQRRYGNVLSGESLVAVRAMVLASKQAESAMAGMWLSIQKEGLPLMSKFAGGVQLIALGLNRELRQGLRGSVDDMEAQALAVTGVDKAFAGLSFGIQQQIKWLNLWGAVGTAAVDSILGPIGFLTGRTQESSRVVVEALKDMGKTQKELEDDFNRRQEQTRKNFAAIRVGYQPGAGGVEGLPNAVQDQKDLDKRRQVQREYADLLTKDARAVEDYHKAMGAEDQKWADRQVDFAQRRRDIILALTRDVEDAAGRFKEVKDQYDKGMSERRLGMDRTLDDYNREQRQTNEQLARETLEVRTKLNTDIAESRRKLNQQLNSLRDDELAAEQKLVRDIAEVRYDLALKEAAIARDQLQAEQKLTRDVGEANYDLSNKIAEINRKERLRRAELNHDEQQARLDLTQKLAELEDSRRSKEIEYEADRIKARRDANKAIEDAERDHQRRLDDIYREVRELPTDFVTADVLRARRELMGKVRDENRRASRDMEDTRRDSGGRRDETIADINRREGSDLADYQKARAAAAAKTEADIAEMRRREALATEESAHDRSLATTETNHRITEMRRAAAEQTEERSHNRELATAEADHRVAEFRRAAAAETVERGKRADAILDEFNHDKALATAEADARIKELRRAAQEREDDRYTKLKRDVDDFNTANQQAYDSTVIKIAEYDKDMRRKIADADTAQTRLSEDFAREERDHKTAQEGIRQELQRTAEDSRKAIDRLVEDNGDWVFSITGVEQAVKNVKAAYQDLYAFLDQRHGEQGGQPSNRSLTTDPYGTLDQMARDLDALTRQYQSGVRR